MPPDDPLDEYEATLRQIRCRANELNQGSAELEAEERLLRQLLDELASALNDAAGHARHADG
jgi:hypothetical protein